MHNPEVAGSNPAPATKQYSNLELRIRNEGAVSKSPSYLLILDSRFFILVEYGWVAQW